MGEDLERHDVEAVLAARRELGLSYEAEIVDAFADRIERVVDERAARRVVGVERGLQAGVEAGKRQFSLGVVSLGVGVPISAITASIAGLEGLVVAWVGDRRRQRGSCVAEPSAPLTGQSAPESAGLAPGPPPGRSKPPFRMMRGGSASDIHEALASRGRPAGRSKQCGPC